MAAKHILREFENRVLRRMSGPKRDKIMGSLRKLHDKAFHNLYTPPHTIRTIKSRRMRWAAHLARLIEDMNTVILVRKPEGNRSLGRSRRRRKDNIRINHTAIA
jgi:hypothetical protein